MPHELQILFLSTNRQTYRQTHNMIVVYMYSYGVLVVVAVGRSRRGHNRSASLTVNMTRLSDTEPSTPPSTSSQHVSQATSAILAQPTVLKVEAWTMPFTFKCIGTFRYSLE